MIEQIVRHVALPWWRAKNAKPLLQQIREVFMLTRRFRATPRQYFSCMLYKRDHKGVVGDYLPLGLVEAYRHSLNPRDAAQPLNDKLTFFRVAQEAGLSVVPVLALSNGQGGLVDADGAVTTLDAVDEARLAHGGQLFCKPAKGYAGRDVSIARTISDINQVVSQSEPMLFQPVVRQHPDLAELNFSSVNCVRIDTLVTENGIVHSSACLKIGAQGALVDNGGLGGLFVGIDLESGRLDGIAVQRAFVSTEKFERHPDSQVVFEGRSVPHWDALKAEVCRAAEVFRPLGSVGWDVAVTKDGPVLIEGNVGWSSTILQSSAGGLAQSEFGRRAITFLKAGKG